MTGDYILDVQPVGGTAQSLYLDPKTFLVRKMVATKGGLAGTVLIDAYQTVSGERVPSKMQISYGGLPLVIDAALQQARVLPKADPALFAVPSSAADYQFLGAPGVQSAAVPFSDDYHEVIVPVTINGQQHRFILDSGAGTSFITGAAAHALGLTSTDMLPAYGYGGSAAAGLATHATIDLPGGLRLRNQNLYVIKDPHVAQALAVRGGIDGGLGYDLLARLTVSVDYTNKTLTLTKPTAYQAPVGAVALPISLTLHVPTVSARIDGRPAGHFLVDTGDSGSIHLYTQYARAHGLLTSASTPGAQTQQAAGIGGVIDEVTTPGHTLALGGTTLGGLAASTSVSSGVSSFSLGAGGIGNGVLSHFVVTFDYARARILLQMPTAASPAPVQVQTAAPAATATAGTPVTDAATAAVLAQHLKALGGKAALSAIRSTRVVQNVQTGGINGTVTTVYKAPDKEYEQDKLGLIDTTDGYDGTTAWQQDSNGNVRMLGEDERRELRLQLYVDTNSYVLPDEGIPGRVTLRPVRESGTGDYILDLLPLDGKPSTIFLDPKTFLIAREQHLDDNVLVVTTFSDYHAVDGVQFPFAQTTSNGTARYDVASQVTKIQNNIPVPDSLFVSPSALGNKAAFLKPGATAASVAFDFSDGEINVPVSINGLSTHVYLDSGASGLALSQNVANALHLKQQGILEARGYGGSTDLHPVKIDTFEVNGAIRLANLEAVSIALPPGFEQTLSGPLAGFIGYDLLSRFVVKIDYRDRLITFIDPAAFTPSPTDGQSLPLNLDNDVPSVTAQFGSLPPAQFLLDTGDESALRLYGPYVDQNQLRQKYPKETPTVGGGIGGESRSEVAKTDAFTVAGTTLHGIPTEFSLDSKGGASQILAGSLGSRLLSRFIVTFDYPHGRVFFAPIAGASDPFDTRTFGVTVAAGRDQRGHLHFVVADVDLGAPALSAGLARDDEILQVDGVPAQALGLAKIRAILSPANSASTHTLVTVKRTGQQQTVTISLFDPLS